MKNKTIANNMKFLRKNNHLKQSNIFTYLNCAESTYSEYENGKRTIPEDIITKLTKYYKIPRDILIGVDLEKESMNKIDSTTAFNLIQKIFPIFNNDDSSNEKLNNYYQQCKNVLNNDLDNLNGQILDEMFELSDFEIENNSINCTFLANYIPLLYIFWDSTLAIDKIPELLEKSEITFDIIDYSQLIYKKLSPKGIEDINEIENRIYKIIRKLKNTEEWKELGDYYLALKHIMCIDEDSIFYDYQQYAGIFQMGDLAIIGNQYAYNYIQLIKAKYSNL